MTRNDYVAKHGPWAEVYTLVTSDGTNTTIAVRELVNEIKRSKLKAELIPVDQKQVRTILQNNGVSMEKLAEISELMVKDRMALDPLVLCIRPDGSAFICDGHHRFVLAHALGQKNIAAFICYPALWEQFLITDLEPMTQEQLKSAPHPSDMAKLFKSSPWKQNQ